MRINFDFLLYFLSLVVSVAAVSGQRMDHDNIFFTPGYYAEHSISEFHMSFGSEVDEGSNTNTVSTIRTESSSTESSSSCGQDIELLVAQEDLRWQLQDVNLHYLENAGLAKACDDSQQQQQQQLRSRNCNLDFGNFPTNLGQVCEEHGGVYIEREHSIQCHNSQTKQQLYYQLDRFPSCFPSSCAKEQVDDMVQSQIDFFRLTLEQDSGMICYADFDILRHAGESNGHRCRVEGVNVVCTLLVAISMIIFGTA